MDLQSEEHPLQSTSGTPLTQQTATATPSLALLHACMLLSGLGTVFLGPVLPALATNAGTTDSGSGLFFAAQFLGAFFGGVTTSRRLWFSLIRGSLAATLGFAALCLCTSAHTSQWYDIAALLPLGFGVGQMLTSVNLLASQRFTQDRGAALSLVNFSLSLGAVAAPFALGSLLPHTSLNALLGWTATLFGAACVFAFVNSRQGAPQSRAAAVTATQAPILGKPAFLYFASLLFLYGGVETSLSGWITTFATRYGNGALQTSTLGATALWCGITAGRALAPLALKRLSESTLLRGSLATAAVLIAWLSQTNSALTIILASALLGITLAPWFPLVLSAMLGEGAAAGEVGTIIAVSGLGAAALPWLVGNVSHATGSLRIALMLPLFALLILLVLSFRRTRTTA